jgi:hypothetical protein
MMPAGPRFSQDFGGLMVIAVLLTPFKNVPFTSQILIAANASLLACPLYSPRCFGAEMGRAIRDVHDGKMGNPLKRTRPVGDVTMIFRNRTAVMKDPNPILPADNRASVCSRINSPSRNARIVPPRTDIKTE